MLACAYTSLIPSYSCRIPVSVSSVSMNRLFGPRERKSRACSRYASGNYGRKASLNSFSTKTEKHSGCMSARLLFSIADHSVPIPLMKLTSIRNAHRILAVVAYGYPQEDVEY